MIELLLLRHAKTEPGAAGFPDHERRLLPSGRRDARRIGTWLLRNSLVPELVLSSDAARARETADIAIGGFPLALPRYDIHELYEADDRDYASILALYGGSARRILVVGHNPGIAQYASRAASGPVHMKTAALAVVEAEVESAEDLSSSSAMTLRDLIRL